MFRFLKPLIAACALAAGVAHEINNPMGFISSNMNSLSRYVEKLSQFISAQDSAIEKCADTDKRRNLRERKAENGGGRQDEWPRGGEKNEILRI